MTNPPNIVVATDLSATSEAAESMAISLALATGARLHWVHAVEMPYPALESYGVLLSQELIDGAHQAAAKQLEERVARALAAGVEGTSEVLDGGAARAIVAYASQVDADPIVLGSHGRTGLQHFFLGSVAERVAQGAECSVLVARAGSVEVGTIVVGTDFSEAAHVAVDRAAGLARLAKAKLHIVHALELAIPYVTPYEVSVPDPVITEACEDAKKKLEALKAELDVPEGVTSEVVSEPAAGALVDTAKVRNAGLVVTGSRGLHGLRHAVLGSVAERTLRRAPCSVWVVHVPDDEQD